MPNLLSNELCQLHVQTLLDWSFRIPIPWSHGWCIRDPLLRSHCCLVRCSVDVCYLHDGRNHVAKSHLHGQRLA